MTVHVRACTHTHTVYVALFSLLQWEIKAPIPSNSFKAITKQMVKLHEALVDILPEDQLGGVFGGIEEVLCRHMSQHLSRLGITNNGSTQHGYVCVCIVYMCVRGRWVGGRWVGTCVCVLL